MDGAPGMDAVIRVVRNRMADPRFPDDACAVILQVAQFQPIAQSALLQKVAQRPGGLQHPADAGAALPQARRLLAEAHRLATRPPAEPRPDRRGLYFVNPDSWTRTVPLVRRPRRTAAIGAHVFLRTIGPWRARRTAGPGLLHGRRGASARPREERRRRVRAASAVKGAARFRVHVHHVPARIDLELDRAVPARQASGRPDSATW